MENNQNIILENIADDAKDLMRSYLSSINEVFAGKSISSSVKSQVLDGIYSYIDEFMEERSGRKLNFGETINLIDKLGSPTEILQSLNISEVDSLTDVPAVFYPRGPSKLRQTVIDHPYATGFFVPYIILVILGLAWGFNRSDGSFQSVVLETMGSMIFPAFIFMIIIGATIDHIFESEVSLETKQKKLAEEYTSLAGIVFVMTYVIGGTFFAGYFIVLSEESEIFLIVGGIMMALFFGSLPLVMAFQIGEAPKPEEMSYHLLLRYKKQVENEVRDEIRENIRVILIPVLTSLLIWNIVLNMLLNNASAIQIVVTNLSIGIFITMLSLSYLTFSVNSWNKMTEMIKKYNV